MAKARGDAAMKGKKSSVIQAAVSTLRRSPRKAVQSEKKAAAEAGAQRIATKVVKRASPNKKFPAPSKKVSPKEATKATPNATASHVTRGQSPSERDSATSSAAVRTLSTPKTRERTQSKTPEDNTTSSPKPRGRPKKSATTTATTTKLAKDVQGAKSSATRKHTPSTVAKAPDSSAADSWTDSPWKRGQTERSSKKVALDTASHRENGADNNARARQASLGGVHNSIEVPVPTKGPRGRSNSPGKKPSASPVRNPGQTPAPVPRSASVQSVASASRRLSKSPAKPEPDKHTESATTVLPKKVAATSKRSHSKSVAKESSTKLASHNSVTEPLGSPVPSQNTSKNATRHRSKSPAKADLAKAASRKSSISSPKRAVSPTRVSRSRARSNSPTKARLADSTSRNPSIGSLTKRSSSQTTAKALTGSSSTSPVETTESFHGLLSPASGPPKISKPTTLRKPSRSPSNCTKQQALRVVENTRSHHSPAKRPQQNPIRTRSVSPSKSVFDSRPVRRLSVPDTTAVRSRSRSPEKSSRSLTSRPSSDATFERRFAKHDDYGRALRSIESAAYKCRKDGRKFQAHGHQVDEQDEDRAKQRGFRRAEFELGLRELGTREQTSTLDHLDTPEADIAPLPKGQPSAPNRGAIHSVTNPEFIPGVNATKKNPFFETMPGPEVWHRRMPPYLPFGETPFMEREMSRQINEDLARGKEQAGGGREPDSGGFLNQFVSGVAGLFGGPKPEAESRSFSSRELPEVSNVEVERAIKELQGTISLGASATGQKRGASGTGASSPPKRVRRRSSSNDRYMTTGALQH